MNGIWLAAIGLSVFFIGYRFYSRFLAKKVYRVDPRFETPAHTYQDGADFVPTNKYVLWGHHFTSVAGAAPIVGPAIAVFWGWLPAFLWVVGGTVLAAGVHDFGTLVLSVRHEGQSVGTIAERLIGERAKVLFLFIILILVLMVNAVFAWVISNLFITFPASVVSIFIQIPLAVWIGYYTYKGDGEMLWPALAALAAMYAAAVAASYMPILQIDLIRYFGGADASVALGLGGTSMAFLVWIVVLMVYVYIASTLDVWKLLQPRDYINSHQLLVGLGILYLGLFFSTPEVTAPAVNATSGGEAAASWFPLLFITVACGAISGFHGLVSSGTSSKQLDGEPDARFVGYLGAVGEGALALITIIAVIVVSFAATSLDTSVRLMRYIISELGSEYELPSLERKHVATGLAVGSSAALVLLPEGPKGFGSGGYLLWPLFGTSNQLLAGISLLLISIWLKRRGSNPIYTLAPMAFLLFMTFWAMIDQVFGEWSGWGAENDMNLLLFGFGAVILGFAVWIVLEAVRAWRTVEEEPRAAG